MSKIYDVIVLGAGPAGLAAGLYAGRSRLSVLIIEKGQDGGQIVEGESGPSLIARMTEQAAKFGAERVSDTIKEVCLEGDVKVLKSEKAEYQGKNVIIATGAHARPIGCKGEAEYTGKGVSYCATCDANFFEDFEVYVVGGGDSAVEEAMYLTKFARKVTIIHRRNELRAAKSIQEKAFKNPKIDFMWDSVVELKLTRTTECSAYSDLSERFRTASRSRALLIWMSADILRRTMICIPIFRVYTQQAMCASRASGK